jgi:hypothetical protein
MPHHVSVGGMVRLNERFKLEALAFLDVQSEAVLASGFDDHFDES